MECHGMPIGQIFLGKPGIKLLATNSHHPFQFISLLWSLSLAKLLRPDKFKTQKPESKGKMKSFLVCVVLVLPAWENVHCCICEALCFLMRVLKTMTSVWNSVTPWHLTPGCGTLSWHVLSRHMNGSAPFPPSNFSEVTLILVFLVFPLGIWAGALQKSHVGI